jgi:hypothetical protein
MDNRDYFISGLRKAVGNNKVLLRKHADERAGKRKIAYSAILDVILTGEVVEYYPDSKPLPACLLMKHTADDIPLYVVCGFDGETCYIITVHWLDSEKWSDPWTRRPR